MSLGINLGVGIQYTNSMLNFEPTNISGISLHLRADAGVSLNGSTVSEWKDLLSGNGHSFIQATGADQPLYTSALAATGWPAITHADATDHLSHATSVSFGAAMTLFLVFYRGTIASTYIFTDSTGAHGIIANFTGSLVEWFVSGGDRQTLANAPIGQHIACITQTNGSNLTGYWDGVQQFSITPVSTLKNLKHLGYAAASNSGNGNKSELILYNRVLAATERAAVTSYLGSRYSVPVTL